MVDSQLFAIKQLLVLREQIAPFEADFAVVERDLGGWGWGGVGGWRWRVAVQGLGSCECMW